VLRRGKAEIIVDGDVIGHVQSGESFGEMALFYGTRRPATLRACGPCEAYHINRAGYQTCMSLLPMNMQGSPLIKVMQKYWDLLSGPGGSNRQVVDYAVYLKYHIHVTKALTSAVDADDYDEDEQREVARSDWTEDTKSHGMKISDSLSQALVFDSVYQVCTTTHTSA
jgi:hypothetical protein